MSPGLMRMLHKTWDIRMMRSLLLGMLLLLPRRTSMSCIVSAMRRAFVCGRIRRCTQWQWLAILNCHDLISPFLISFVGVGGGENALVGLDTICYLCLLMSLRYTFSFSQLASVLEWKALYINSLCEYIENLTQLESTSISCDSLSKYCDVIIAISLLIHEKTLTRPRITTQYNVTCQQEPRKITRPKEGQKSNTSRSMQKIHILLKHCHMQGTQPTSRDANPDTVGYAGLSCAHTLHLIILSSARPSTLRNLRCVGICTFQERRIHINAPLKLGPPIAETFQRYNFMALI